MYTVPQSVVTRGSNLISYLDDEAAVFVKRKSWVAINDFQKLVILLELAFKRLITSTYLVWGKIEKGGALIISNSTPWTTL